MLASLTPIVVTAVAWIAFHQRPASLFLLAVALSVTGSAVMALAQGTGRDAVDPAKLIPPMLARFMATDRVFAKLRRTRSKQAA